MGLERAHAWPVRTLSVGKLCTSNFSQMSLPPGAVQSTSPAILLGWFEKASISLSQSGFIDLQWPHQGARNLMKTVLPMVSSSQLSGVSSVAPVAAMSAKAARMLLARMARVVVSPRAVAA